jgi:hypothetical protein
MSKYVYINIHRPIYGSYVGIREKYIWQAKREGKKLFIRIPQGTAIVSPEKFLRGATRIEKVFLQPDNPMVLYCNTVYVDKPTPIEDVTIPFDVKERLRELAIERGII